MREDVKFNTLKYRKELIKKDPDRDGKLINDRSKYKEIGDGKLESVDLAFEYMVGCLEGYCEIDEDLLEACVDIVNENTDILSVDDYSTILESVEYLYEISSETY